MKKNRNSSSSGPCAFSIPDIERHRRQNFPEAIYAPGKTIPQMISIAEKILASGSTVMITRTDDKTFKSIKRKFGWAKYYELARIIAVTAGKSRVKTGPVKSADTEKPYACIVTAGTSDIPVAEEAAVTCELMGNNVCRVYDIGIAGIHRVEKNRDKLYNATCVVVCAGMEGALPGIIGGLVAVPVIGVPTSVGYGTAFKGLTSLFTMLNSCVANVCCVNIDDGYGAGILAHLMNCAHKNK